MSPVPGSGGQVAHHPPPPPGPKSRCPTHSGRVKPPRGTEVWIRSVTCEGWGVLTAVPRGDDMRSSSSLLRGSGRRVAPRYQTAPGHRASSHFNQAPPRPQCVRATSFIFIYWCDLPQKMRDKVTKAIAPRMHWSHRPLPAHNSYTLPPPTVF